MASRPVLSLARVLVSVSVSVSVVVCLGSSLVFGDTTFRDGVSVDSNLFFAGAGGSVSAPRESEIQRNSGQWYAQAIAAAGAGRIETRTLGGRTEGTFGGYAQARATPSFRLDDLVLRKLPGFESQPNTVQATLTVHIDYQRSGSGAGDLFVQGGLHSTATSLGSYTQSTSTSVTSSRNLTVGVPFFVSISVDTKSSKSDSVVGTEEAHTAIYLDPTSILQFALEGYTVDGASGFVVDNEIVHCGNDPVGTGMACEIIVTSVNDVSVAEGATSEQAEAVFTVSLSAPSPVAVSVDAATADQSATAGVDYLPRAQTLRFPPGAVEQSMSVTVLGNDLQESDREFLLRLSNPVFAAVADGEGVATIQDDDASAPPPLPGISVDDPLVLEGNGGVESAIFTLSLSEPSAVGVSVSVQTSDGTAIGETDYKSALGVVAFEAGVMSASFEVAVISDRLSEADETFHLILGEASGAVVTDPAGMATIVDDDAFPKLRIGNATVDEGDKDSTTASFAVRLNRASGQTIRVAFATESGGAKAGADFVDANGLVEFVPGELVVDVPVMVLGDVVDESNEDFFVVLSDPAGAEVAKSTGRGRIRDDDTRPSITIEDAPEVIEGDGEGPVEAVFTVTLSHPSGRGVSVEYQTRDDDARQSEDYEAVSGSLDFPEGVTSRVVAVPILGDGMREVDETFSVRLRQARFARIERRSGNAVIADDDAAFTLFNPDANGHDWANAFLLAYASLKVYEPEVAPPFESGFTELFTELGMDADSFEFIDASSFLFDTQAAMMSNDEVLIITFRGTEFGQPEMWIDLFNDAAFSLVPLPQLPVAQVHSGFLLALEPAYSAVLARALLARAQGKRVWVTGHSLGGALATLCAFRLALDGVEVQGVYTYGSPRVGNPAFAVVYDSFHAQRPLQRWVDDADLVPLLPPPLSPFPPHLLVYEHVGQTNNILLRNGAYRARLDDGENFIPGVPSVDDHHPANYVNRIRSNVPPALRVLLPFAVPAP